jgi:CRP/FNR family transcriptional regulator, cyclic AMP receptor protein
MSITRIPAEVIAASRFFEAKPGDVLLRAGDSRGEVLLIENGLLQLDRSFEDGNRSVRIAGPSELVGEESLLGEPCAQQVEAITAAGIRVINVANAHPQLSAVRWLLGRVTQQLQQTDRENHWMRIHTVDTRVQLHLLSLNEKAGGAEIPITQSDFAQVVGATRETISTALNRLARGEIIRLSRGSITVLKPELLNDNS